ncbi:ATP-dependent protease subunit HslV [Hellea sp.]|jgi:ATP-dependent HslUV protease subunit HslV|nr:ATP-dependent protease subunit HslV [Hellea sp.]
MSTLDYADASKWRGTTILSVRKNGKIVVVGDGQVSAGNTVMKASAKKVRTLAGGNVITGFAGATADAFALLERLEAKLEQYPTQLARACVELAKDWRTDKYLRQLQAMMIVADNSDTFVLTGNGDVVEPDKLSSGSRIIAIGSGGNFALSAALAMDDYEKDAEVLAKKSMSIANKLCVFTNDNLTVESLKTK